MALATGVFVVFSDIHRRLAPIRSLNQQTASAIPLTKSTPLPEVSQGDTLARAGWVSFVAAKRATNDNGGDDVLV